MFFLIMTTISDYGSFRCINRQDLTLSTLDLFPLISQIVMIVVTEGN